MYWFALNTRGLNSAGTTFGDGNLPHGDTVYYRAAMHATDPAPNDYPKGAIQSLQLTNNVTGVPIVTGIASYSGELQNTGLFSIEAGATMQLIGPTTFNGPNGGTLDAGHGLLQIQGGTVNIAKETSGQQYAMGGYDSGGNDFAYNQTGGTVNLNGTAELWNPAVQGGVLNIGPTGTVNPSATAMTAAAESDTGFQPVSGSTFGRSTGGTPVSLSDAPTAPLIITGSGTVVNDGIIEGSVELQSGGTLLGTGLIAGDLAAGGLVEPGDLAPGIAADGLVQPGDLAPGILWVSGAFTLESTGTLGIAVAWYGCSSLNVDGAGTLGGALWLQFLDGFIPGEGETFTIGWFGGGVSGAFSSIHADNAEGFTFTPSVDGGFLKVTATPAPEPGTLSLLGLAAVAVERLCLKAEIGFATKRHKSRKERISGPFWGGSQSHPPGESLIGSVGRVQLSVFEFFVLFCGYLIAGFRIRKRLPVAFRLSRAQQIQSGGDRRAVNHGIADRPAHVP